jgi:hypothetical protein
LAISAVIKAHPRWVNLGLEWLTAFDAIDLAEIRRSAKATGVRPLYAAITTLLCVRLAQILGPSRLPKPKPAVKVKLPPKPPRAVSRIPEVEKNIELGRKLVALRSRVKSNRAYGRAVRAQFDLDTQLAVECARVAKAYGDRPEIYRRLSWEGLIQLSSPALPSTLRQGLERRILAGERIGAPQIRRARGKQQTGRPKQRSDHPITQMAA